MDSAERAIFKEQLKAMAAGRGDGIDLDTPERWVIGSLLRSVAFFRHVELLIPGDSILYFEGINFAPEVASFYESHRATNGAVCLVRDTILLWAMKNLQGPNTLALVEESVILLEEMRRVGMASYPA
jgi:hypothetical protein